MTPYDPLLGPAFDEPDPFKRRDPRPNSAVHQQNPQEEQRIRPQTVSPSRAEINPREEPVSREQTRGHKTSAQLVRQEVAPKYRALLGQERTNPVLQL